MRIYFFIVNTLLVTAIPSTVNPWPEGYTRYHPQTVLDKPAGHGFNGDQFCQGHFSAWWALYQQEREGRKGRAVVKVELNEEFTHYPNNEHPDLTAPVEAFAGTPFPPFNFGWRAGLWGCFTGCQDIRITIEWIMAMEVEEKQHVRARLNLAFLCEAGLVAIQDWPAPSIREKESPEAIQSALETLQTERLRRTKRDKTSVKGEEGPLTKCSCVKPTASELVMANQIRSKQGNTSSGLHARVPGKRKRDDDWTLTENPGSTQTGVPELPKRIRVRFKIDKSAKTDQGDEVDDTQEHPLPNPMTCYDFDYPDIPLVMFPAIDQPQPAVAPTDEETVGEMLRAALNAVADFDWDGPGETSDNPRSSGNGGKN